MELNKGPKDARGRVLQEGDEILLNVKGPVYYRVVKIRPNLDSKLPPDMVYVDVAVVIPFLCQGGAINREFIRVRTIDEAGPTNVSLTDIQAPPPPAPPPGPRLVDTEGGGR